jgi:predicted SAM-dependent methyltransferase
MDVSPVLAPADAQPVIITSDRIHYGCGDRVLEGWTNVDVFDESYPYGVVDLDTKKRIVQADLAARHPFRDGTFQWGYCEDFLEHLTSRSRSSARRIAHSNAVVCCGSRSQASRACSAGT